MTQSSLFSSGEQVPPAYKANLSQWMTPSWVAEALLERHYGHLGRGDVVIEPTCGDGAFLLAMPSDVEAIGVEIDPDLAALAASRSRRRVIVGDFRSINLDVTPTHLIGNLPFVSKVVDGILRRGFDLLPMEGTAGFILPAYAFQTSSTVTELSERWSMMVELIPRTVFGKLSHPLVFAQFRKTPNRVLVGLALFQEAYDIERMPKPVRETLRRSCGSTWFSVLDQVLESLGGEASLEQIYAAVEPKRPSGNPYWKEKIRQTAQIHFERTGRGRYARKWAEAA